MPPTETEKLIEMITAAVKKELLAAGIIGQKTERLEPPAAVESRFFTGRLINEAMVTGLVQEGVRTIRKMPGTLLTPSAQDLIRNHKITVIDSDNDQRAQDAMRIGLVCPSVSPALQKQLIDSCAGFGAEISQYGSAARTYAQTEEAVIGLAGKIMQGTERYGIVIDEKIFCLNIAANRIDGIRGNICWDIDSARLSRNGCSANILFLNQKLLGEKPIPEIVRAWL